MHFIYGAKSFKRATIVVKPSLYQIPNICGNTEMESEKDILATKNLFLKSLHDTVPKMVYQWPTFCTMFWWDWMTAQPSAG